MDATGAEELAILLAGDEGIPGAGESTAAGAGEAAAAAPPSERRVLLGGIGGGQRLTQRAEGSFHGHWQRVRNASPRPCVSRRVGSSMHDEACKADDGKPLLQALLGDAHTSGAPAAADDTLQNSCVKNVLHPAPQCARD